MAEGGLTESYQYLNAEVYVPGSKWDVINPPVPRKEPVYNNVLGVFALLETPEVVVDRVSETFTENGAVWVNRSSEYKLASDIKYVINPASGLVLDDIAFSFVVKNTADIDYGEYRGVTEVDVYNGGNGNFFKSPIIPLGCSSDYVMQLDADFAHPLLPPPRYLS
ncbi:MAG TPA: hypothetical protein ENK85_01860 [Saprospiraceae bacterium]|nr:hypothetical protein [Saprospiraceae bacterium]